MKNKFFKLLKFLLMWGLTYGINIWLTYTLVDIFHFSSQQGYFLSLLIVAIINFLSSLFFTFSSQYSHYVLWKYIFWLTIITGANYVLVQLCTYYLWKNVLYFAIFCMTTFFFFVKFYVYEKFVFQKHTS